MSQPLIQFLDKTDCQTHALKVCEDAAQQLPHHLQLKNMSDIKFLGANYVPHKAPDGTTKVVLWSSDPEAELEEAVWEVQGILLDYDLPPILHRNRLPKKPTWAKQSVRLIGFSSSIFEQAVSGIAAIHHLINSVYSVSSLRPWVPDQVDDHPSFMFSNRYVTPLSQLNGHSAIAFGDTVDPHGVLLQATSSSDAHLDENKVEYYERVSDDVSSDYNYTTVDPAVIRSGQIVQVQVFFVTVPLWGKKGSYQMTCKLRSIAILDRQLQEVYDMQAYAAQLDKTVSSPKIIKRCIGYSVRDTSKRTKTTQVRLDGLEDTFMKDTSSSTV